MSLAGKPFTVKVGLLYDDIPAVDIFQLVTACSIYELLQHPNETSSMCPA